jgi:hypothetical protein
MGERWAWVDGERVAWPVGKPPPIALYANHPPYELVVKVGARFAEKMELPPLGTDGAERGAVTAAHAADMLVSWMSLKAGMYPPESIRGPLARIWIGPCDAAGRPRGAGSDWWGITVKPASP